MRIVEVGVGELADPSESLVVGAYNIAHGRGGTVGAKNRRSDGRAGLLKHLEAIGAEIARQGMNIVVLNEVDFSSSWSWRVNQAEVIAKAAGLPYVFEQRSYDASLLIYGWEFGNAVLSRYPLSDPGVIRYPAFKNHETFFIGKKDGGSCTITTPDGDVRVVAVHLEVRDRTTRHRSMEVLSRLEASEGERRYLIMGDFNNKVVFADSDRLTSGGGFEGTFPSSAPDRKIDWLFAGPGLRLADERTFGGELSDHLGVLAVLTFPD